MANADQPRDLLHETLEGGDVPKGLLTKNELRPYKKELWYD